MDSAPPPPPVQPGSHIPGWKPGVIVWYKVYVGFMILMFLLLAAAGGVLFAEVFPLTAEDLDGMPPKELGILYLALGVIFAIPYLVALFLPRKKWVWVYHMVMICLGMTGCTIVASIPLLIFWLKPEVKAYYDESMW